MKILLYFLIIGCANILLAQSPEVIANIESKGHRLSPTQLHDRMQSPELIDVTYYDLNFIFDSSLNNFTGISKVNFIMLEETNQVTLDAQTNLNTESVFQDENIPVTFTRTSNHIIVQLNETKSIGEVLSLTVQYQTNINNSEALTKEYHNGIPIVSSLSEPFYASTWWVGIDNLKDKADTVDIRVTHPAAYKVGSNGLLISEENIGNALKTTHWRTEYPIPAYLVSIAMSNYVEYNNTATVSGTSVPIINYVYPENLTDEVQTQLDAVPYYVEFFSDLVGDYPYKNEKYGHAQWNWGGGMEHSTMSSQIHFETSLTAHELAHQWFGNKVTCGTWSDVWLNEGFAVYLEGLLRRDLYGEEFFYQWKLSRNNFVMSQDDGSVYIPPAQAFSDNRIFSARLSYYKAAMVVHMLRFKLGDENFYQALQNYLNDPLLAYGFATTPDLQNHMETQSGLDLDEFFADWVYGEGFPYMSAEMDYNQNNHTAALTISQIPSHESVDFFETEIEIELISSDSSSEIRRLNLTQNDQVFYLEDLPVNFSSYELNPNQDILTHVYNATLNTMDITRNDVLGLQLYPNPVVSQLHLLAPEVIQEVQILDARAKLLLSKKINDREADIYVQILAPGTYFIEVSYSDRKETKKFIKK